VSAARDLAYLCRELKAPSLLAGVERLAERARAGLDELALDRREEALGYRVIPALTG